METQRVPRNVYDHPVTEWGLRDVHEKFPHHGSHPHQTLRGTYPKISLDRQMSRDKDSVYKEGVASKKKMVLPERLYVSEKYGDQK